MRFLIAVLMIGFAGAAQADPCVAELPALGAEFGRDMFAMHV